MGHIRGVSGTDDFAVFHHYQAVRQIKHVMQIMADQENANSFSFQLFDKLAHLRGFLWAQGCCGFIHNQDARIEVNGTSDGNRLALATGEF